MAPESTAMISIRMTITVAIPAVAAVTLALQVLHFPLVPVNVQNVHDRLTVCSIHHKVG